MFNVPYYNLKPIRVTPTVTTSAYTAGDAIGEVQQLVRAVPSRGGKSLLESLAIFDAAKQTPVLDLLFFNSKPTATTDNAAYDVADAIGRKNFLGSVHVATTDYVSLNDNALGTKKDINLDLLAYSSYDLWMVIVSGGTPTFVAADDLGITLNFRQFE